MNRFLEKHVLAVSENAGVGESLISMFLREGARVSLFGREDKSLEDFRGAYRGLELAVVTKLDAPDDFENAFRTLDSRWGRLDVFVNNIINSNFFKRMYKKNKLQTQEIISMTKAKINDLTNRAAERMKTHGGVILNIGFERSLSLKTWQNEGKIYLNINKNLQGWTREIARELAPKIRINTVLAGNVLTDGQDPAFAMSQDIIEYKGDKLPEEIDKGADVVSLCSFLCSREASYISGQTFIVEAGKKHMAL